MGTVAVIGTIVLLIIAFLVGPRFCGKLCPAGAVPEYLSKMIPARFKINWNDYVPVVPWALWISGRILDIASIRGIPCLLLLQSLCF